MYRTYNSGESKEEKKYEERLIPKEVADENVKICSEGEKQMAIAKNSLPNLFGGLFNGIEMDDLIIIALLILLLYESCEDNIIIIILVALLFIK